MKSLYVWSVVIFAAANTKASILYNQAADSLPISSVSALTSYDPLPNAADDFTPGTDWLVTGATFRGNWTTGTGADPTTLTRPFTFNFYADANGPIDPPIRSFTADASLSLAYIFQASNADSSVYDLSVDFPTGIYLTAGRKYWFSAVDEGLGRNGAYGFFWSISPEGNNFVAMKSQDGWTVYQQDQFYAPHDLVFALVGTAVPEPSALFMCGTAFVAFGAALVCRNSQN